ncbi:MAG: hypothetical protein QM760_07815 [Nibricoccus sp.]
MKKYPVVIAKLLPLALLVLLFSGCSTFVTPRYAMSADTNLAFKTLTAKNVTVGSILAPPQFDTMCRGAGPLGTTDGLTHTAYIKKALEDELKVAGIYTAEAPRITLNGVITKLDFSSSRGLTGGSWEIELKLDSSNGKSMTMREYYEFKSGFIADTACKQTAEAFLPTVQNLLQKIAKSPEFKTLLE